MQIEIRCVKLIKQLQMSEFDCHSPLNDCIIEFACANGFNLCKKLNRIRAVRLHMACTGVGCACGRVAENMGVCLFHFTQGSWVCASLYRRAANMSQSWALKPGYRLQESKHHKSDDTWISLSKPGNKSLTTTVTIANKCEIAHIPDSHLHGLLERNVRLSLFRVTAGLEVSHSPPRWTIRCLGVSKNSRHTSCVGNSRQQHSALVPLWPLGMLYDQLFLKHANMLNKTWRKPQTLQLRVHNVSITSHIRQSDIKITLYCSNLRRWQLYIYREL